MRRDNFNEHREIRQRTLETKIDLQNAKKEYLEATFEFEEEYKQGLLDSIDVRSSFYLYNQSVGAFVMTFKTPAQMRAVAGILIRYADLYHPNDTKDND